MTTVNSDATCSNVVTPPDFLDNTDPNKTVLIIDPSWSDIEDLALYLKSSTLAYTVYVYRSDMNGDEWLAEAATRCGIMIINTEQTELSPRKDKMVLQPNAFYYGPKNFLMSSLKVNKPIDWFIQHEQLTQ
jgi:hypothetical protein